MRRCAGVSEAKPAAEILSRRRRIWRCAGVSKFEKWPRSRAAVELASNEAACQPLNSCVAPTGLELK